MKDGIYEKLLYKDTKEALNLKNADIRKVDASESPKVVSLAYQKIIRGILVQKSDEERLDFIKDLNEYMGIEEFSTNEKDSKFEELLCISEKDDSLNNLRDLRPKTSLASSTLFTGSMGPSLESELKREIRTADRIDFLVSFIKFSGIRLLYDDLKEFTKTRKLRIITTSYMGASDYKAVELLAKLPNTEVKISYDTQRTRLHAKAYYFERDTGFSTAYIGSSNISNPALSNGLEWNLKVSEYTSIDVINSFLKTYETYWNDSEFRYFNPEDEEDKKELKRSLQNKSNDPNMIMFDLFLHGYQKEIIEDLRTERQEFGSYRNLVVAATGTGKTMVSAFDYKDFRNKNKSSKLLFIAHRKEILEQSMYTYRNVLKDQNFGDLWGNGQIPSQHDYLFVTVQTLSSNGNNERFAKDNFDYIVIDESHHSTASTYFKILEYFNPKILLGLTATPERMDGEDIKKFFNNRIASEIRLPDAIDRKLLCPFHYFGVTDSVDLSNLMWSRGGYERGQLENVYTADTQRVNAILKAMNTYLKDILEMKALGFCVGIEHANFMAYSFNQAGIPSIALHSNSSKDERNSAKEKLRTGQINCIFTVDLFNEGVDIPEADTVLFLRPTESLTVFIQQLGRGLRLSDGKEVLTVLDFVGQAHKNYDFSSKLRTMIGRGKRNLRDEINDDFPNMPAGCHIKLERIAKEYILNNIQSSYFNIKKLRYMINIFRDNYDVELNLENFLEYYSIDKNQFYSKYSFRKLLFECKRIDKYENRDVKELKNSLRRFSRIDSKRLLKFGIEILSQKKSVDKLDAYEKLMMGMLHYTIWGNKPEINYKESLSVLINHNKDILAELLEIANYNLKHYKVVEIPYEDGEVPLDLYASYNKEQIMASFGVTHETHLYPIRQGVHFVRDRNTDIFMVTINKNEEDYISTTMYNDYAISNELFNWESQSTTSVESPTGQRYIYDRSDKHKVLFFVRENKKEFGNAPPYVFMGNARYESHKGSKPIQMVWKMDHSIPERIILESRLKMG
jgi:superfamily II DNA or RNA helicase